MIPTKRTVVIVPVFKLDTLDLTEIFDRVTNKDAPCWTTITKQRALTLEIINSLGLKRCYPDLNKKKFERIFAGGLIAILIVGKDVVACTKKKVEILNIELEKELKLHNFLYTPASEEEARRDLAQIFP